MATLPSGYTQLEYIESTGTQYIDTGFKPNNNTVFEVDLLSKNTNCHVFGARTSYHNKAFCLFWASKNNLAVQMSNSTFNGGSFDTSARNLVTMSSSRLKINGVVTSNYSVDSFQCEKTAWLMSCYSSSTSEYFVNSSLHFSYPILCIKIFNAVLSLFTMVCSNK